MSPNPAENIPCGLKEVKCRHCPAYSTCPEGIELSMTWTLAFMQSLVAKLGNNVIKVDFEARKIIPDKEIVIEQGNNQGYLNCEFYPPKTLDQGNI